ncbi:MAG: retron system putative HNH endonuclease [Thiothrix litoralis]|uniref:retron system putative HNH endonuclease n=1 Tax=Thiothrix litoralis TaxID=2891210 RepID=UPI003C72EFBE
MKKTNKSHAPKELIGFAQAFPYASWDEFRDYNGGADYASLKRIIFADQGQLCAFCETHLESTDAQKHLQRIEHFHSKSDTGTEHNWALDWENLIGVCLGGSGLDNDSTLYPTPQNLSCDAYKDHLIKKNKLPVECNGLLLNPLFIPAFPCLFTLEKRSGKLLPDEGACGQVDIPGNRCDSVATLVQNTIDVLNLNCDRLNQQRLVVLHDYERRVKQARLKNDKTIFYTLAQRWFSLHWPAFFTTRRILLGSHAEVHLQTMSYNG